MEKPYVLGFITAGLLGSGIAVAILTQSRGAIPEIVIGGFMLIFTIIFWFMDGF